MKGYEKIAIFHQYLALSLKWYKIWPYSPWTANETVPKHSNGTIFSDLERTLTKISRSRYYLTLNISEAVLYRHSYKWNTKLIGTYHTLLRVSFRMSLSDLEWLSEIFNDTKHRAVSLWRLSFYCLRFTETLLVGDDFDIGDVRVLPGEMLNVQMWHVSVMTTTVRCELWVCQTVSAQCSLSIIRRVYVIANLTRRRRPSAAGPACRHVARPLTHIPSLVSGLIDGVDIAAAAAAGNRTKRHGRRLDSTRVMPISWKDVAHVEIGPSVRPYVSIVCPSAWCYWCCGRAACTLLRYMINGATL